jgi:hypothetical protein
VICCCTTLAPYVCDNPDFYLAWLYSAEEMQTCSDVQFFAALELDGRGVEPFVPLLNRLLALGGDQWSFSFDDGATEYKTENRLRRITMGQNLCSQFALDAGASHMLFMAADCQPPGDAIPKLLEVDWPIVGGEVGGAVPGQMSTYGLRGSEVRDHPATHEPFPFPVEEHMATAAFVMIQRQLLKRVKWRYDLDTASTDDPCLYADALALGYPTLVRKDCFARHYPDVIGPIETRGHDRAIRR